MSAQHRTGDPAGDILARTDDAAVRTLTFCRPEAANAFNGALYRATTSALRTAATDDSVSVVVLTGRGTTFSAGTDLVEMAAMVSGLDEAADDAGHPFAEFIDALSNFPKPLLAAVNGAGVGLGLTMLLHCDLVLMAKDARLRVPFSAMGVAPEAASSYLLPRRTGRQQAALTLFTSRWLSADEAVTQGLALTTCRPETLLLETLEIARAIAIHPLPSLMAIKELLLDAEREGVARARAGEDAAFARLLRQPGMGEGVTRQLGHGGRP
jgi:enoyl-CoA hydratase/carnithine racemase